MVGREGWWKWRVVEGSGGKGLGHLLCMKPWVPKSIIVRFVTLDKCMLYYCCLNSHGVVEVRVGI